MKNLLSHINKNGWFNKETEVLVKVQIDNSLELGWSAEDIMLVTNFPYEYRGVKAIVIGDDAYCEYSPISVKVTSTIKLFDMGLIESGTMYWAHDFDAFQQVPISESEVDLEGFDMALCPFARMPKFAGGSIFFKSGSADIFRKIKEVMDENRIVDEIAVTMLAGRDEAIAKRIKTNNITYNFLPYNIGTCYKMALKPIRVAHFHPFVGLPKYNIPNTLNFYKGDNRLKQSFLEPRFIKILDSYGIK